MVSDELSHAKRTREPEEVRTIAEDFSVGPHDEVHVFVHSGAVAAHVDDAVLDQPNDGGHIGRRVPRDGRTDMWFATGRFMIVELIPDGAGCQYLSRRADRQDLVMSNTLTCVSVNRISRPYLAPAGRQDAR